MTLVADKPRSPEVIAAELVEADTELERRNREERDRRREKVVRLEDVVTRLLVDRDKGARVTTEQIAKAQRDVGDAELEVRANDATIGDLTQRLEELRREHLLAKGEEALDRERSIQAQLPEAKRELLKALIAVSNARSREYRLDSGLHQVQTELDKLADQSGDTRFRRGVFVFSGAYRPQVDRVVDAIQPLMTELAVSLDEGGRIVPRTQAVPAPVAVAEAHEDDQVDDDDIDDEDLD